eukprot:SAG31_NODE_44343_length_263_cov_0.634146_1_plen_38_part_01
MGRRRQDFSLDCLVSQVLTGEVTLVLGPTVPLDQRALV